MKHLILLLLLLFINIPQSYAQRIVISGVRSHLGSNIYSDSIAIKNIADPKLYEDARFNVHFIGYPDTITIIPYIYHAHRLSIDKSFYVYGDMGGPPGVILTPEAKAYDKLPGGIIIVTDEASQIDTINRFEGGSGSDGFHSRSTLNLEDVKNLESIFNAEFLDSYRDGFLDSLEDPRYDMPFLSVRHIWSEWWIVDSFLFKKGWDYGYRYYVTRYHSEEEQKTLGGFLYNTSSKHLTPIHQPDIFSWVPFLFGIGGDTYLFSRIGIGAEGSAVGIYQILEDRVIPIYMD